MIPGSKPRAIASFIYIPHGDQELPRTCPNDGERFVGVPYGYYAENSLHFIEVYRGEQLVATVNYADISYIEYPTNIGTHEAKESKS
jgi:hypothetical protein